MTEKLRKVFSPEGARLLVDDIVSETTLEHRADKIGLALVVEHKNRPRNTMGYVVAIGTDPMLHEEIEVEGVRRPRYVVGDEVCFDWHAGSLQIIEGHEFRSLSLHEVTGCFRRLPEPLEPPSPFRGEAELAAQNDTRLDQEQLLDRFGMTLKGPWQPQPVDTVLRGNHEDPEPTP